MLFFSYNFSDLTKKDFVDTLRERSQEYLTDKYKILFIVIMTHGQENGKLFCSDGQSINLREVIETFQAVRNKPKVR